MKVLHLATHDTVGGAARAAYRQHLALRQHGVDSRMLVRHKHSNDADVTVYLGDRSFFRRAWRVLRRTWIDYQEKRSRNSSRKIVCGLTDPRADLLRRVDAEISDANSRLPNVNPLLGSNHTPPPTRDTAPGSHSLQ